MQVRCPKIAIDGAHHLEMWWAGSPLELAQNHWAASVIEPAQSLSQLNDWATPQIIELAQSCGNFATDCHLNMSYRRNRKWIHVTILRETHFKPVTRYTICDISLVINSLVFEVTEWGTLVCNVVLIRIIMYLHLNYVRTNSNSTRMFLKLYTKTLLFIYFILWCTRFQCMWIAYGIILISRYTLWNLYGSVCLQ